MISYGRRISYSVTGDIIFSLVVKDEIDVTKRRKIRVGGEENGKRRKGRGKNEEDRMRRKMGK